MCFPFAPSPCKARRYLPVTVIDLLAYMAGSVLWRRMGVRQSRGAPAFSRRVCGSLSARSGKEGASLGWFVGNVGPVHWCSGGALIHLAEPIINQQSGLWISWKCGNRPLNSPAPQER
jgi:hypothetical protein